MNEERKKIHRPRTHIETEEILESEKKDNQVGVIEKIENVELTAELPEFKAVTEEMPIQKIEDIAPTAPIKNKKRRALSIIANVFLFLLLFAWLAIVVTDFLHVKRKEEPQFCVFSNKTTDYDDGKVSECTGLGYKVIKYDRVTFKAVEFGPFWIEDRTAQK